LGKPPDKSPVDLSSPSIEGALQRAAEVFTPLPPPRAPPGDRSIDAALSSISERTGAALSPSQTVVRAYKVGEVAQVLAAFAAVMLLFDSEGLVTWARRMEVGPAQGAWLSVLGPIEKGLDIAHFTAPRHGLLTGVEAASRLLGAGEDPLFADAWGLVEVAPYLDAQEIEPTGEIPVPAALEDAQAPADTRAAVLLVGDSMLAANLGASISSTFAGDPKLRIVSAYQTATGLTRPDVFDWGRVVTRLLERERPAYVICSLGANDSQSMRLGDELLPFGSADWDAVYRVRVKAMMRSLTSGGAKVLWLGLPPMRDAGLSRRSTHLNRMFAQEARQHPGVEFLELSMLFAEPGGEYSSFLTVGKSVVRVRLEDGVHYSPPGARLLAQWVDDWVHERKLRPR
jgi:lysophospholipase L1-like esterase